LFVCSLSFAKLIKDTYLILNESSQKSWGRGNGNFWD
jgi:hypothetical protein